MLQRPDHIGVGIDEKSALVLHGNRVGMFGLLGKSVWYHFPDPAAGRVFRYRLGVGESLELPMPVRGASPHVLEERLRVIRPPDVITARERRAAGSTRGSGVHSQASGLARRARIVPCADRVVDRAAWTVPPGHGTGETMPEGYRPRQERRWPDANATTAKTRDLNRCTAPDTFIRRLRAVRGTGTVPRPNF